MLESDHGPVDGLLHEVWQSVRTIDSGQVADYIPELAKADPAPAALSLATLDGAVYTAGDLVPFTIQSVSKPFVYALALADSGADAVLSKIGAEPTGDPFNTISLDDVSGRAFNPMVNAGAIVTATLVPGDGPAPSSSTGSSTGCPPSPGAPLDVDEDVYASERDTGDRNRAIAYLMRSAGLLDHDVDDQVEMYFRQCSIVVTARDLAVMAATLANAGVNPTTGEQVIPRHVVAPVLTVMSTCGMYDYAGEWLYRVGMPAKSGVSGAISAVLPGQMGLAAHSPRLDPRGNSVRGVAACEQLSSRLGLHLLLPTERSRPNVRRTYRGDLVRSKRTRPAADRALLEAEGRDDRRPRAGRRPGVRRRRVAGPDGAVGPRARPVAGAGHGPGHADRRRRPDPARRAGRAAAVRRRWSSGSWSRAGGGRGRSPGRSARTCPGSPTATARSSGARPQLLRSHGIEESLDEGLVALADQDLLSGLPAEVVAEIEARTTTRVFTSGTVVFNEGDEPDGLYFIGAGQVSADVRVRGQRGRRRLNSMAAGVLVRGAGAGRRAAAVHPDRGAGVDHLLRAVARGIRGPAGRGPRRVRPADPGDRPEPVAAAAGVDLRGCRTGGVLTRPLRKSPNSQ